MRVIISYLLWPFLFASAMVVTGWGMTTDHAVLTFNVAYLGLAAAIGILERLMPHERQWLAQDGQIFADLGHTLLNKGLVQVAVLVTTVVGVADLAGADEASLGLAIWPVEWPMWAQALLALVVAEFGLYWAHRIAHEVPLLWRFHAVHHSVTRLWFVNTGRFHFVDTFLSILLSQPLLYLMGAPLPVFLWVSATTAFIGILTHCNIEMRFGPLNYFVNTPGLHRWHHSMDLREGNKNYGENLMIWDQIFGTFFNGDYRPPATIGIPGRMPASFTEQLYTPFTREGAAQILGEPAESQQEASPAEGRIKLAD